MPTAREQIVAVSTAHTPEACVQNDFGGMSAGVTTLARHSRVYLQRSTG